MDFRELVNKIEVLDGLKNSEENLKYHVTSWMLKELGYDEDKFDYEHSLCRVGKKDKHADIFIPIENELGMLVETKRYSKDLDYDDMRQLIEYMDSKSRITWGILTNGRQIVLMSNDINVDIDGKKDYLKRVVLNVEMNPVTKQFKNAKYIKYFTMENIFVTHVTNYYKAVAQFLAKHSISKESENKYKNTLWRFFDYYISNVNNEYRVYDGRPYAPLEEITDKDFVEFLKQIEPKTRKASGKVPLAKCSHIYTMYDVLEKNIYIAHNTMKNVRNRAKAAYEKNESEKQLKNILTPESIKIIMSRLNHKSYKIVIFTLVTYYGFSRENVLKFLSSSWSIIDFKAHTFKLGSIKYPLVRIMEENLKQMMENYRKRGIRNPSAIYVYKKGKKYLPVSTNSISAVFEEIKKYTEENINWTMFNPQNLRGEVIYKMLCSGCTIEEISYITDTSLSQLVRYLPDDIIKRNGEKEWKRKNGDRFNHPFREFFD